MAKLSKWDQRWVDRAKYVAEYSKDKNTKTGAVIIDIDNNELVMGYNGFPRGADDDSDQRRYEKPQKYFWTEHAERNALYKAARLGISTNGSSMYCTYFPCADCSRAIIQGGIKKLFTDKPDFNHHKWGESWVEALIMLRECGVEVIWTNETQCQYNPAWTFGGCKNGKLDGNIYCEIHHNRKCTCGEQAIIDCSEYAGSFVCGTPLCKKCYNTHKHSK